MLYPVQNRLTFIWTVISKSWKSQVQSYGHFSDLGVERANASYRRGRTNVVPKSLWQRVIFLRKRCRDQVVVGAV